MPLSRLITLIGLALAVGCALGGGRWTLQPLIFCWPAAAERGEDETESAGGIAGRRSVEEVTARFPVRLAPLVSPSKPNQPFDSGDWAAREAARRCAVLALMLSASLGGGWYAGRWVARKEADAVRD